MIRMIVIFSSSKLEVPTESSSVVQRREMSVFYHEDVSGSAIFRTLVHQIELNLRFGGDTHPTMNGLSVMVNDAVFHFSNSKILTEYYIRTPLNVL